MMNESHTPTSDLMQLLDASDWPAIAAIEPDQFKKDWPRLLDDYVAGERDNFDDLMTIGVVCGGNNELELDRATVNWLLSQSHSRATEITCNVLAGCWQPQLYVEAIDNSLLRDLLKQSVRLRLDDDARHSLISLLQQVVGMQSAKDLPDDLREQMAEITGDE